MQNTRRQLIQSLAAGGALLALSGCASRRSQQPAVPPKPLSPEDQALKEKFAVLKGGGERFVSALSEFEGVNILDENGRYFAAFGGIGPWGGSKSFYGSEFGVPKTLHVTWRSGDDVRMQYNGMFGGGKVVGDYTVEVASRIPEDLLADLRRDPRGTFRLKIRLHDDGVLIGWDIERRPGYDPNNRNKNGNPIHVPAEHSFAGGDFREAHIFNGKPVRKGWYIHPKTGELIETDT